MMLERDADKIQKRDVAELKPTTVSFDLVKELQRMSPARDISVSKPGTLPTVELFDDGRKSNDKDGDQKVKDDGRKGNDKDGDQKVKDDGRKGNDKDGDQKVKDDGRKGNDKDGDQKEKDDSRKAMSMKLAFKPVLPIEKTLGR